MVADLGVSEGVRRAGRVSDEGLARLYGQARLFALATRYEGYGLVFDEALLAGLPIVTCATGAVPDTVPSGAGVLVPPGDAPAFAAALDGVLKDPVRCEALASAARAAGRTLPTWGDTARIAGAVLDRLYRAA